jgi:hypothetical protein
MSTMADGAEAIKGCDAKCGGEVTVRAAACCALFKSQAHLGSQSLGFSKKCRAEFAFERSAVESAADFQACARKNRAERVQAALEAARVCYAECTKIEDGAGTLSDYIHTSSALDDVRVHGHAVARVVPLLDACELARKLVNRVDTFLRGEARVRSAAMDDELGLTYAFARRFDQSSRPKRRLEYKDGITAAGFCFDEFPRALTADLFVGSPKEY